MILDDTMGFEHTPRIYRDVCPSLRASRNGLKTTSTSNLGVIDPQGRTKKKLRITETCPTLRAQIHGNPSCAVYEVKQNE